MEEVTEQHLSKTDDNYSTAEEGHGVATLTCRPNNAHRIRIVNIHRFTQREFLSRHVTNRNNHNNYTYSTNA